LRTYRAVLGDGSFGELFVGGDRPRKWEHVFASIQSLDRDSDASDHWYVLVIDEFHHAEASSYRRLLSRFHAGEVLGLTATPERADGVDVREFFDGRTAYELRLWDALEQDLLCPFHYYGISDNTICAMSNGPLVNTVQERSLRCTPATMLGHCSSSRRFARRS